MTGGGDDWDNRTAAEIADTSIYFDGADTSDNGSAGSKWTDITLSTSYGQAGNTSDNFLGNFPDPSGTGVPNQPIFNFQFSIPKAENPTAFPVFFNMVFGDYDVRMPSR